MTMTADMPGRSSWCGSATGAAAAFVVTLLFSPETRGKELVPQLTLVEQPA